MLRLLETFASVAYPSPANIPSCSTPEVWWSLQGLDTSIWHPTIVAKFYPKAHAIQHLALMRYLVGENTSCICLLLHSCRPATLLQRTFESHDYFTDTTSISTSIMNNYRTQPILATSPLSPLNPQTHTTEKANLECKINATQGLALQSSLTHTPPISIAAPPTLQAPNSKHLPTLKPHRKAINITISNPQSTLNPQLQKPTHTQYHQASSHTTIFPSTISIPST